MRQQVRTLNEGMNIDKGFKFGCKSKFFFQKMIMKCLSDTIVQAVQRSLS